jgi:hypothetical protein
MTGVRCVAIVLDGSADLDPVGAGHRDVQDEEIRAHVLCELRYELPGGSLHDLVTGPLERSTEKLARDRLVVGDQDRRRPLRAEGFARVFVDHGRPLPQVTFDMTVRTILCAGRREHGGGSIGWA